MIAATKCDHSRFSRVQQRGLQRRLDGLEAGVAQDRLRTARTPPLECQRTQPLAHFGLQLRGMHVAHRVHELRRLRGERVADFRPSVPRRRDAKCGREIEKAVAIRIPHIHALGALPENRPVLRGECHIPRLDAPQPRGKFARTRARDVALDLGKHAMPFVEMRRQRKPEDTRMALPSHAPSHGRR